MPWIAGVDGCPAGWFRICRRIGTDEIRFDLLTTAAELLQTAPAPDVLAIDMPIGLPAAGARSCDRAARQLLGPRRSSVFPAPIRPALDAATREEASRITRATDGRGVGAQAWGIYRKVAETDRLLRQRADARGRVFEVHPELSYRAWAGDTPMAHGKKTRAGHDERLAMVEAWTRPGILGAARGAWPKSQLADDDILDAFACLWTAERIAGGRHVTLPDPAPLDASGLPMRIVY